MLDERGACFASSYSWSSSLECAPLRSGNIGTLGLGEDGLLPSLGEEGNASLSSKGFDGEEKGLGKNEEDVASLADAMG